MLCRCGCNKKMHEWLYDEQKNNTGCRIHFKCKKFTPRKEKVDVVQAK